MRKLARLIETELEKQEICAVYNSHLGRVWPLRMGAAKRKEQIKRFATKHALDVTFYDVGLCAIFEKSREPARNSKRILVLEDGKDGGPRRTRKRQS
jgi:hypothetical protein